MRILGLAGGCGAALVFALGCAPFQTVPVDIEPRGSAVYLDGEVLKEDSQVLKLRADRDHTVLVKRDGHRGELVVLRTVVREGEPVLEPEEVRVRLQPLGSGRREVEIELRNPNPETAP